MTEKKWRGTWPSKCDICHVELADTTTFYDAKTIYGPWGLLCPECFNKYGLGLGTGRGQEYDSKTLLKLRG